jgi:hypothetical protein
MSPRDCGEIFLKNFNMPLEFWNLEDRIAYETSSFFFFFFPSVLSP